MIFTKIEIENFGIFRGKHIFNLRPGKSSSSPKPIILFGGKNGSGKTTLFEAIRLCLYGPSFKGRKMYNSLYHKHLRQRLNRNVSEALNPRKASICVEFEYGRFGRVDTYLVRRSWKCNGNKVIESLQIHQNSRPLRDIDEEKWQEQERAFLLLLPVCAPGHRRSLFGALDAWPEADRELWRRVGDDP